MRKKSFLFSIVEYAYLSLLILSHIIFLIISSGGIWHQYLFIEIITAVFSILILIIGFFETVHKWLMLLVKALFSLLTGVLTIQSTFVLFYIVIITFWPNYTIVAGKRYQVMPTGQIFLAVILSLSISIVILSKYFKSNNILKRACEKNA